MIYKRSEYIEEDPEDQKFPVKNIDVLEPLDESPKKFVGHVSLGLQTAMGIQQLPISFEIEASHVAEAFQKFAAAAEPRIEETRRNIEQELQRMRQEQASRIVRPGEMGMPANGQGVIDFKNLKKP